MTVSRKRAGLVLLVALSTWAPSGYFVAQELRGPVHVLFTFVREDARKAVPLEMRPYEVRRMFLKVDREVPGRDALGSLEKRNLERLGVTLVDDKTGVLVLDSIGSGGSYVRDDGVYVVITSVDTVDNGALAITFSYYVTWRQTGLKPMICLQERRIVQRPAGAGRASWGVVEARSMGHC